MLLYYPPAFERDMGCSEAQWLQWLPGAVGACELRLGQGRAEVVLPEGMLHLAWRPAEPRVVGLVRLPRLLVSFRFEGAGAPMRLRFMRYFDLYMQRGGG